MLQNNCAQREVFRFQILHLEKRESIKETACNISRFGLAGGGFRRYNRKKIGQPRARENVEDLFAMEKLRILFTGDSITDVNRTDMVRMTEEWMSRDPNATPQQREEAVDRALGCGYPLLVASQLGAQEPGRYEFLNRGISGNRVVKAFAREDYEIDRFDEKNADYKKANTRASLLWLQYSPYIEGLSQSLSIAVLLVGGVFLITGRISIGTFTLFNGLTWTLTDPMRMLGMHLNDLQRFFASANKIIELYYAKSTITSRPDAKKLQGRMKGEIDFSGVDLNLHGQPVLRHIDLHINPGETVAIMGPTGSGKTSLVNLIPRFSDVSGGTLTIDGTPVGRYDLHDLRHSIGIATQDVFLFSDTVDGNIAYGDSSLSEEDVKRYAKMADVDFVEKLPDGFDTLIGERGTGLSGGQKQRIALARALAVRPSILILDDTTSAVDLETEKYIQEQLASLDFPCTKIIVAQRISTTKRADKIVILDKGRVVDIGTHEELSQRPGYYREVFLLQNGMEEEKEVV